MANKLIHVARYQGPDGHPVYLFLRRVGDTYRWFQESRSGKELPLELEASQISEALRLAAERFVDEDYLPLECGFRFDQAQRDEHGINALFHQMVASYSSNHIEGNYFDVELGHECKVENASEDALALWKKLEVEGRL